MKAVKLLFFALLLSTAAAAQQPSVYLGPYTYIPNRGTEIRSEKVTSSLWSSGVSRFDDTVYLGGRAFAITRPEADSGRDIATTAFVMRAVAEGGGGGPGTDYSDKIDSIRLNGMNVYEYYGSPNATSSRIAFTIPGSGITPAALTKTDDTNVTATLGGTPGTALLQATSITLGWTGTLAATRGGTGTGTVAAGDLLYGTGVNTWGKLTAGSNGYVLTLAGGVPTWAAPSGGGSSTLAALTDVNLVGLTNGQIIQYNSTTGDWENEDALALAITGLADGDMLAYSTSASAWVNIPGGAGGSSWGLLGNAGTSATLNAIGTTDNINLRFIRWGVTSGLIDSSAQALTWLGYATGNTTISAAVLASGFGFKTGNALTTGDYYLGIGPFAGWKVTTGVQNLMAGARAGYNTTTGGYNLFAGTDAGYTNVSGGSNIYLAPGAGYSGTGSSNILGGLNAGYWKGAGDNNVSWGIFSLNGTGGTRERNVNLGNYGLQNCTSCTDNVTVGHEAGQSITTGQFMTIVGRGAKGGTTVSYTSALGYAALAAMTTGGGAHSIVGTNGLTNLTTGDNVSGIGMQVGQYYGPNNANNALTSLTQSVLLGARTGPYSNGETNTTVVGYTARGLGSHTQVYGNSSHLQAFMAGRFTSATGVIMETPAFAQTYIRSRTRGFIPPQMTQAQRDAMTLTSSPIDYITITAGGTGYTPGIYTWTTTGGGGTGATGTITVGGPGGITAISVLDYGRGYTSNPTLSFSAGAGSGATFNVQIVNANGLTIFCEDCTATDGSTGVFQTYSSSSWRNHY
jgi:hypothetical protein